MKKLNVIILFFLLGSFIAGNACTTAVVSGKATKDGRPLLWKHRDTWTINNKIVQFFDGKYACTGLVNSVDTANLSIWIGFNSEGFAIMNSASYNLNNDTIKQTGLEGRLMKEALQNCADIDEFEAFLKNLEKPVRLEANFGVIDAKGGAAYFELGNFEYFKYDANDPAVAPDGYLIRTNYSFAGMKGKGGGYIRYKTADSVFRKALAKDDLTFKTMLQGCSRSLTHSLLNVNLYDYADIPANTPKMVFFKDFIPRNGTSASCVVQGVKPGENPQLAVMWSIVGFPLTSVTIPVFLVREAGLPQVLQMNDRINDSPLCNYSLLLKEKIFDYDIGADSKYYIDVNQLVNADHTGFVQQVIPFEDQIISKTEQYLGKWRKKNKIDVKALMDLYAWIDKEVEGFYQKKFNLSYLQVATKAQN